MIPSEGAVAATPDPLRLNSRLLALGAGVLALVALYHAPLFQLVHFALGHDLYSYILLIPVVSGYLAWINRQQWQASGTGRWPLALAAALAGAALLGWYRLGDGLAAESDYLCLMTLSLWCFLTALCCALLSRATLRAATFPLGFLLFAVPMPDRVYHAVESFLQSASADVSQLMIEAVATPVWREGMVLHMPGMNIEVAPECCGIHSTLVLLITSVLASHLFLRSPVRKAVLVAAILPIALLRNGFRIMVISELCVHISPDMIHSYIHTHGGPIFFGLSLVPFLALLQLLRRRELRSGRAAAA